MKSFAVTVLIGVLCALVCFQSVEAQSTEITYQGQLQSSSMPASGSYDFEFVLYDSISGGSQIGPGLTRNGVTVANGVFSVNLDFGSSFPGAARYLEIRVRQTGGGAFTTLLPRQPIASSPYSIKALSADSALNSTTASSANTATSFSGTLSGDVSGTQNATLVTRIQNRNVSPAAPSGGQVLKYNSGTNQWEPGADNGGAGNFIENTTTQQPNSNFNISGNGTVGGTLTAGTLKADTQFNIGFDRVIGITGSDNLYLGIGAGAANTSGSSNTFAGYIAGGSNTTGTSNAFFGSGSGLSNTTGSRNSFFGNGAGLNSSADDNSFFGTNAGLDNTSGFRNSFFGLSAGQSNTTGNNNSFFGRLAGYSNTSGNGNTFLGESAGYANTTSSSSVYIGSGAGSQATGGFNAFTGRSSGLSTTTGTNNTFSGYSSGYQNTTGGSNTFIGDTAGFNNTTGSSNVAVGMSAGFGQPGLTNATSIGSLARTDQSNSMVLGSIAGVNLATATVNVGIGTTSPQARLHVNTGGGLFTQTDGREVSIGTPNGESGIGIRGTTNRADIRFDGSTLKLVAGLGSVVPGSTNGISVNTAGLVGLGTTTPAHRLTVIGGPHWTSSLWAGAVELSNAAAIAWQPNAAGWSWGIGQTNGGMYIFQSSSVPGSTTSPATYALSLTDGGNVGIGTISPDRKLSVNGGASKAGGGSWEVFSDERLKNISGGFGRGLKAVLGLRPLTYRYRIDNVLGLEADKEYVGFSAQEVEKLIPEAVSKNADGYRLVNNDPIILAMLNAIKEQQAEIDKLRSELRSQKRRLGRLSRRPLR